MANVLIIDDETAFVDGIAAYLRRAGHQAVGVNTLAVARDITRDEVPDVVLLDLMLPDGSGLELLDAFEKTRPKQIIIVTGHSGVKSLIGDVAGPGVTYLQKPVEPADVISLINAVDTGEQTVGSNQSDSEASGVVLPGQMIGASAAMENVHTLLRQVAPTGTAVLVQGESGTGKELVAEALHALSQRSGAFVPVNCGGLSSELVSSQLFGHEKGSFTGASGRHKGFFQRAANGTLFLDEITEMPLDMQTHLLRALETGRVLPVGAEQDIEIDARLVAATNRDPAEAIREGHLREDLYFRLNVFPITLPPLREREKDARLLAQYFLDALNSSEGTSRYFTDDALENLAHHDWPGNVRELKHAVHRAHILATTDLIEQIPVNAPAIDRGVEGIRAGRSIADVERDLILATLKANGDDKKAAAASLGVSLKTLYNRLRDYSEEAAG
ncbi:MAG: sigma-54 dependent transcriptional regulator [Pseudomonadota bacterium]